MLEFLRKIFGARNVDTGDAGERLAAAWLRREKGFRIVARNWRSPRDRRDELDLVARDGDVLVFVEVKVRAADARVPGFHAVDARKKRVLRRAAETYLRGMRERPRTYRFDVVEIAMPVATSDGGGGVGRDEGERAPAPEVRHFENVPLFGKDFRG